VLLEKNIDLSTIENLKNIKHIDLSNHEDFRPTIKKKEEKVTITATRNSAFRFHYPSDLKALERAGAKLIFFDTIKNNKLPYVDG